MTPSDPPHFDPGMLPGLDPETLKEMGLSVIVTFVEPGTPAEEVGLMPGDAIVAVSEGEIDSQDQVTDLIGSMNPGHTVDLTVMRGEETLNFEVTLSEHPDESVRGYLGVHLSFGSFLRGANRQIPTDLTISFPGLAWRQAIEGYRSSRRAISQIPRPGNTVNAIIPVIE